MRVEDCLVAHGFNMLGLKSELLKLDAAIIVFLREREKKMFALKLVY